jgi:hypothetical protein
MIGDVRPRLSGRTHRARDEASTRCISIFAVLDPARGRLRYADHPRTVVSGD